MNHLTKKRACVVVAFSLALTGSAAYAGVSNSGHKADTAGTLSAGISAAVTDTEADALNVTAGVTDRLFDRTSVYVRQNDTYLVSQGQETDETDEADEAESETLYGYTNLGIAHVEEGSLNVRKSASTDSEVVGKMTDQDACEILKTDGDWTKIKSGKVKGYVMSKYLLTGDEAAEAAEDAVIKVVTVNTTTLRVREHATEDSAVLTLVGEGEDLIVEKEKNGWYKVEVDDQKGYISGDYVDVTEKLPTASSMKELTYGDGYTDTRVSLVQYALQFVGNRYVWGGTSLTNGIDCSGFTMQIYAHYGISLPHHAASQPAYGTRISASDAKPGDLFFYGSGSSISHVGIYIGNGQIVHASNARTGIKISSAYYRSPICVVSYLN